jgi:hypothetical protein
VVIRDVATLDVLGECQVPAPVEVGDLLALEHGPRAKARIEEAARPNRERRGWRRQRP